VDTSSPRDTLLGFLADSKQFIQDYRLQNTGENTYQAFRRASHVLDFSTTPEGDSWFVRSRCIALLQELLARIELSPASEIPGDREIADGTISQWSIPNTNISIARITQGVQAGQFLFSAETVKQLDRLYRQAKRLPYRPGATPGIYEELLISDARMNVQERQVRDRLKPIDTSSP